MSEFDASRVFQLLQESSDLPWGQLRTSLCEEAVRIADSLCDEDLMFRARMGLLESAGFSGRTELRFTTLAWCLPRFEAEPERYREHEFHLLWYLKNTLMDVADHPQITLDQGYRMYDQMKSLYQRAGYNMRTVYFVRCQLAIGIGDRELTRELYQKYRGMERDDMAHCPACERDLAVEYHIYMDEMERALDVAVPCLEKWQVCAEVPQRTYARVLRPLAMLRRFDEADEYQKVGYRMIRSNEAYLDQIAGHMTYLTYRGELQKASNMFSRHLIWALHQYNLGARFRYFVASRYVLQALAQRKPKYKFRLPKEFALYEPSDEYDLDTLLDWLEQQITELAQRFDERNGTTYFSRELPGRIVY